MRLRDVPRALEGTVPAPASEAGCNHVGALTNAAIASGARLSRAWRPASPALAVSAKRAGRYARAGRSRIEGEDARSASRVGRLVRSNAFHSSVRSG